MSDERWPVTSEAELLVFYELSFDAAYRCAGRLARGDRAAAEDLVQDAYVRLIRAAQDRSVDQVGIGWLVTTIRRRFLDRLRSAEREQRRARLVAVDATAVDQPESGWSAPLDGLGERERAALIFRYVDGLPVGQVADLLGASVRATESLLQRAKRKARGSGDGS